MRLCLAHFSVVALVSLSTANLSLAQGIVAPLEASPDPRQEIILPDDKDAHAPLQVQDPASSTLAVQEQMRSQAQTGSKLQSNQLRTRFVIGLRKRAEYDVFLLNNPYRVVIDLAETKLRLPEQPNGKTIGLIKGFRAGLSAPGRARIVLELIAPAVVVSAKLEAAGKADEQRLIIDLAPRDLGSREAKMAALKFKRLCPGVTGDLADLDTVSRRP